MAIFDTLLQRSTTSNEQMEHSLTMWHSRQEMLKSLSPTMKLERLSPQFETRSFRSRRSLAFVKTEDLDSFIPSPGKLILAERRILEAELNNIKAENHQQPTRLEPKRLNIIPSVSTAEKPTGETP